MRTRARRVASPRNRFRSLAWLAAAGLAMCLPDRPLAIAAPLEWQPSSLSERPAGEPLPKVQPRGLSQAEFDRVWEEVKFAMAGCNDAVDSIQLAWRVRGEVPDDAAFRLVRDRCQRASAEVYEVTIPASAGARARIMLEQAQEACQRSMVEKQLGLAALRRLVEAQPDSLEAYEARIRIEAISRSSINCGSSFAAAGAAAHLHMAEMEVAGA